VKVRGLLKKPRWAATLLGALTAAALAAPATAAAQQSVFETFAKDSADNGAQASIVGGRAA
jgi:hypothetical protein